mmetsp:Transcript_1519/g.4517  ORF Transcript_1519/g.4517 Transcript_1519/m.4517 type:complete len:217 (+) Transcript_1519:385-1035(+)
MMRSEGPPGNYEEGRRRAKGEKRGAAKDETTGRGRSEEPRGGRRKERAVAPGGKRWSRRTQKSEDTGAFLLPSSGDGPPLVVQLEILDVELVHVISVGLVRRRRRRGRRRRRRGRRRRRFVGGGGFGGVGGLRRRRRGLGLAVGPFVELLLPGARRRRLLLHFLGLPVLGVQREQTKPHEKGAQHFLQARQRLRDELHLCSEHRRRRHRRRDVPSR